MTVRPWLVTAVSLSTLAAWTWSAPASPVRYRLEVKTSVTQDLTAVGQGEQKQEFSNTGFVTISAKDSAGGQALTVVLDSMVAGEGSPFAGEMAKNAAGTTWTGFRQPNGRVKELKPNNESPAAGALQGVLQQLLPPMKAGTREGQAWTDTTETDNEGVAVRTVTNFQTSGETVNGAKVVKLAGSSSTAMSGQQTTPQGSMSLEGTGSGTASWLVATDGTCLSSTFSGIQNIAVTVAQLPEPIPVMVKLEGSSALLK
jgi:hypothetical protein